MGEILGALFRYLVMLIGIAAVVLVLYRTMSSSSVSNEISNLATLQTNLASLYVSSQATTGTTSLNNAVAINSGSAPTSMVSGNTLVNQWNKPVTVSGDANYDIIIQDTGIPQSACAKIVTSTPNYAQVTINGTLLTAPVDPGTATTACQANDNNSLNFTYTRAGTGCTGSARACQRAGLGG